MKGEATPGSEAESVTEPIPEPSVEAQAEPGDAPVAAPAAEAPAEPVTPPPAPEEEVGTPTTIAPPPPPEAWGLAPPPPQSSGLAPTRRRSGRVWIAVALIVVLLLGLAGGAAAFLNATLSSTYSAQRAVTDYFGAQTAGNVDGMMSNATFDFGAGTHDDQSNRVDLIAMMTVPENLRITGVHVDSVSTVDANTRSVGVSMSWNNQPFTHTYTVVKDTTRRHYYLYHSWLVEIPYATVTFKLPNQATQVQLDGALIAPSAVSAGSVDAIQGYHHLTMVANAFYDSWTQPVAGIEPAPPIVTFPTAVSQSAMQTLGTAIKDAFQNCDATKYDGCFAHTYSAPNDGYVWQWDVPGSGWVDYNTYVYNLTGDPTAGMTVTVGTDSGKATASGTCTSTLTIDGSKNFNLKGSWSANLTVTGGNFNALVTSDCGTSAA